MQTPDDSILRGKDRSPTSASPALVACRGIHKSFGGAPVLDGVDFELRPGEIHVLAGENGAGKSTLMRILSGVLRPDAGTIAVAGQPVSLGSVHDAATHGIAMIHQELSLAPSMSVMDNLVLGREPNRFGWLDRRTVRGAAERALRRVGLDVDPARIVSTLPLGARQLIEIAKALLRDARVLIMDEPTSALTRPEVTRLFGLMRELVGNAERPSGIVYISHRTEEIYAIADRLTVLRDGRFVITATPTELPAGALIHAMVGREVDERSIRPRPRPSAAAAADAPPPLSIRGLSLGESLRDCSLSVGAGEIVGLAGLQGSGAGALLHALFGDGRIDAGEVLLDGCAYRPSSPRDAIDRGVALLTEDRGVTGLCQGLTIRSNVTMALLGARRPRPTLTRSGWLLRGQESRVAERAIADHGVRCRDPEQAVCELSGGNQQKVALAKWLVTGPRLLLLHDPTRGVDVGARSEIYRLINAATDRGAAVLVTSSDLPELLGLADRVIVLHRGRITARFTHDEATPHAVIAAAMGEVQSTPSRTEMLPGVAS